MLEEQLATLLEETPASAEGRERQLREELEARPGAPVVLYGAGNLGRRTASLLRSHGRDVAAFIDNAASLHGTVVDGIKVLSPAEATDRFGAAGVVIVTIWRAEGGHDFLVTRAELQRRGWRRVESFIPLFWGYGRDALPYITIGPPSDVLRARSSVLTAAQLWSDPWSLGQYVGQVRWRLTGDFSALTPPEPDQYFAQGIVRIGPHEVFVDCGAFTGDTLMEVHRRVGSWRAYHAFEPDPASFDVLARVTASLAPALADHVHLPQAATSDRSGKARFNASGLAGASLSAGGGLEVDCVTIDDAVTDAPPTFIKMDIEGAEAAALSGARRAILDGRPLLALAAYHRQADLWELPLMVHGMAPADRMFLRPHAGEGFDTVLYAVPPERLAAG